MCDVGDILHCCLFAAVCSLLSLLTSSRGPGDFGPQHGLARAVARHSYFFPKRAIPKNAGV